MVWQIQVCLYEQPQHSMHLTHEHYHILSKGDQTKGVIFVVESDSEAEHVQLVHVDLNNQENHPYTESFFYFFHNSAARRSLDML